MTFDPITDELLSRHVDGETTEAEAARVEADPALMARVETLRSLADLLSVDTPAPDVDRLRTEALAASPNVVGLDHARQMRGRGSRAPVWLGAAAALVALVLGSGALLRNSSSRTATEVASMDAAADGAEGLTAATELTETDEFAEPAELAEAGAADMAATTNESTDMAAADDASPLVTVASQAELASAVIELSWPSGPDDPVCDEALAVLTETLVDPVVALRVVSALVAGSPVEVVQARTEAGENAMVSFVPGACPVAEALSIPTP
jgi:anti-sigma factor RsiW